MNALLNHTPIPFFDRIPPRAKDAYLSVFDGVADMAWSAESAYRSFSASLSLLSIDCPTFPEFKDWYWRVRKGVVVRPFPTETLAAHEPAGGEGIYEPAPAPSHPPSRFEQSLAIVKASHKLFKAQQEAGYSPASLGSDDEIIADALRDVLGSLANSSLMDADMHMTTGNKLVDLLLGQGSDEIDSTLVECLTLHMQAELCAVLVRHEFLSTPFRNSHSNPPVE